LAWGGDCRKPTKLPFGKTCKMTKLKEIAYGLRQGKLPNFTEAKFIQNFKVSRRRGRGGISTKYIGKVECPCLPRAAPLLQQSATRNIGKHPMLQLMSQTVGISTDTLLLLLLLSYLDGDKSDRYMSGINNMWWNKLHIYAFVDFTKLV
jgi:hypothetical protein